MCSRFYRGNRVVLPSDMAEVILEENGRYVKRQFCWGFPYEREGRKQLIFNARAETAHSKKIFSESLMLRRCLIPCHGFYEWDSDKNKIDFHYKEQEELYLAGFYKAVQGELRFVVLTVPANQSVADVHDRMPLLLLPTEMDRWLNGSETYKELMEREGLYLDRSSDYFQQRFDFNL